LIAERFVRTRPDRGVIERVIEGIARDVGDLRGNERLGAAPSAGGTVGRGHEVVDRERAEGALVGEDDGELAVLRMRDVDRTRS
jgi:hypothetical protein